MPRNRRRWRWRAWLIGAPLLLVGLFGLIQLVLATPWACRRVSERIEDRLGLETHIERLSWSPWDGVVVHGLSVAKPPALGDAPLLTCAEVRVWPDYPAWLRGRREVRGLELVEPELELDVPLVLSLASQALGEAPEPPAVAAVEPRATPGGSTAAKPETPDTDAAPAGRVETPAPDAGRRPARVEEGGRVTWLTVRGAELRVMMPGGEDALLSIGKVDGSLPLSGPGDGRLAGSAHSDLLETGPTSVRLSLEGTQSSPRIAHLKISGKKLQATVDTLFQLEKAIPFKTIASIRFQDRNSWHLGDEWKGDFAPSIMSFEAMGWLAYPGSWSARGEARSDGLSVRGEGVALDFDRVSGRVELVRGRLRCPDFRLIGQPASLLGNGWLGRGAGAAVVRITLPDGAADGVGSRAGGIAWKRLEPGGRAYADLTVWLDEAGLWRVELGEGGPELPWDEWMRRLRSGRGLGR